METILETIKIGSKWWVSGELEGCPFGPWNSQLEADGHTAALNQTISHQDDHDYWHSPRITAMEGKVTRILERDAGWIK